MFIVQVIVHVTYNQVLLTPCDKLKNSSICYDQYFIVLIYVELNNSSYNMKDTLYDSMPQLFMDAPKIGKDPSPDLS